MCRSAVRTNEQTDGRRDESTNESMLARILDESCFVVCVEVLCKSIWSLLLL